MAWSSFLLPTLMILSLSSTSTPTFAISFQFPNHNLPIKPGPSLSGDAHFTGNGSTVQLTQPTPSSFGIMFPNTPLNFTSSTSLSSHFTFQLGSAVEMVIIPANFPSKFDKNMPFEVIKANRLLGIEFYANVCTISYSRVSKISRLDNDLKEGVKLASWVDYRAVLKRLDVRLSKLGDPKPVEPLISYRVDLGEILKGEQVLLGLGSGNEGYGQITYVYSWSSEIKDVPKWLHSIPVDPKGYSAVQVSENKGSVFSGCVFATSCGVLAALIMYFVWSYVVDQRRVEGEDFVRPVDFKYEKIDVVEVKNSETVMK